VAPSFDPPWRLDPLKRFTKVSWGTGAIGVLAMSARVSGSAPITGPPVSWNAYLTASCDDPDMRGLSLLEEAGPSVAPPGPPAANIVSENDFWCYPRQFAETSETSSSTYHFVDRGKYVIFTSSGVITLHYDALDPVNPDVPFIIDFHTPPDLSGGGGLAVLPGNNAGNLLNGYIDRIVNLVFSPRPAVIFPQLIEELISHDEVVNIRRTEKSWKTITFLNLPRIANRWPDIRNSGKLDVVAQMQGVNDRTFIEWSLALGTFAGVKKFTPEPTSPLLVASVPPKDPAGFQFEEDDRAPETAMPSVEVTFSIDLATNAVTVTRQNL
jgi:hypothetical protein